MKNIEINAKTLKKLFATGLLAFTIAGCSTNEPAKEPAKKEEQTEEVGKEKNKNSFQYVEMSEEETKKLKAGDFVEATSDKETKIPNIKVLESMGYDYEISFGYRFGPVDEEMNAVQGSYRYYGEDILKDSNYTTFEKEGKQMQSEFFIQGVNIAKINKVFMDGDTPMKEVELIGDIVTVPLADTTNYEKLQQLNSVSYVYSKTK